MLAFALVRHRFRGRATSNVLIFIPMATPEIVLGASLLTIFVQGFSRFGLRLGFWTIVIAHIMFCISFVVVTVKARLQSLDPRLEEAAQDLYAGPGGTFWRVTFPLVLPGIVSARAAVVLAVASTTSSSPTSSRATRRRSRSSSTCPTCAESRPGQRDRLLDVRHRRRCSWWSASSSGTPGSK